MVGAAGWDAAGSAVGRAPAADGSTSALAQPARARARSAFLVRRWAFMGGTSWASVPRRRPVAGWDLGRSQPTTILCALQRNRACPSAYSYALDAGARAWDAASTGHGRTGYRPT